MDSIKEGSMGPIKVENADLLTIIDLMIGFDRTIERLSVRCAEEEDRFWKKAREICGLDPQKKYAFCGLDRTIRGV